MLIVDVLVWQSINRINRMLSSWSVMDSKTRNSRPEIAAPFSRLKNYAE